MAEFSCAGVIFSILLVLSRRNFAGDVFPVIVDPGGKSDGTRTIILELGDTKLSTWRI